VTAQEQICKMLINDFSFALFASKTTNFGERWTLRSSAGLEASLGVYRICFYHFDDSVDKAENNFPASRKPLCFDTDRRGEIKSYLEKSLGIKPKIKKKIRRRSSTPTLFEF
jgi:hypothetical protein